MNLTTNSNGLVVIFHIRSGNKKKQVKIVLLNETNQIDEFQCEL